MINILKIGPPDCPLCFKQMREVLTAQGAYFVCTEDECMISIHSSDLAVGKWYEASKKMEPCVRCGTIMRCFFRCSDGFKKVQCHRCRREGKLVQVQSGPVKYMSKKAQQNWSAEADGT